MKVFAAIELTNGRIGSIDPELCGAVIDLGDTREIHVGSNVYSSKESREAIVSKLESACNMFEGMTPWQWHLSQEFEFPAPRIPRESCDDDFLVPSCQTIPRPELTCWAPPEEEYVGCYCSC